MERIPIPVTKALPTFPGKTLITLAISVFSVGIFVGVLVSAIAPLRIPLNPRDTLGAVGESQISRETQANPPSQVKIEPHSARISSIPVAAHTPEDPSALAARRGALAESIRAQTLSLNQRTQDIERLKDESVSLVAAFQQNCGNWNDPCAATYTASLKKNEAASTEALTLQAALYQELIRAERALNDLEE